jgi:hypothetical protein
MQLLGRIQRCSFAAVRVYENFYDGKFVPSKSTTFFEVYNPVTQEHIARSPQSTHEEFNAIVASAAEAFKTWSKVPLLSTYSVTQPANATCSTWLLLSDVTTVFWQTS